MCIATIDGPDIFRQSETTKPFSCEGCEGSALCRGLSRDEEQNKR